MSKFTGDIGPEEEDGLGWEGLLPKRKPDYLDGVMDNSQPIGTIILTADEAKRVMEFIEAADEFHSKYATLYCDQTAAYDMHRKAVADIKLGD